MYIRGLTCVLYLTVSVHADVRCVQCDDSETNAQLDALCRPFSLPSTALEAAQASGSSGYLTHHLRRRFDTTFETGQTSGAAHDV